MLSSLAALAHSFCQCKRLKLKCDRRTPCGSCTKRGTVSRCIYSPAAAEKVDLHSLNNRLIQVEAILAMVTAGQTPPPFQSSYPLAQVALPQSHSGTKLKSGHATVTSPPSISVRFNDLATIWLCHSQLDSYGSAEQTGQGFEIATDIVPGTFVKVEVPPTDTLPPPPTHLQRDHDHPSKSYRSLASLQFDLPPLYAYYPSATFPPSQSSTVVQLQQTQSSHYSSSSTQNSPHHAGPSTGFPPTPPPSQSLPKPAASNTLFSFLPVPATRIKLLNRARIAHPHIALVTPWNRLVALADPSSKDEKGKRTALANAVFFNANRTESPANIRAQVPSSFMASKISALPIFISLCYALALGVLETDESPPVDPAFLHALAGQALGLWEEFRTSDTMEGRDEIRERESKGRKKGGQSRDELDYVVACLLQVKYLMRLGSSSQGGVTSTLETVFPLVCLYFYSRSSLQLSFLDRKTSESGTQSRPRS